MSLRCSRSQDLELYRHPITSKYPLWTTILSQFKRKMSRRITRASIINISPIKAGKAKMFINWALCKTSKWGRAIRWTVSTINSFPKITPEHPICSSHPMHKCAPLQSLPRLSTPPLPKECTSLLQQPLHHPIRLTLRWESTRLVGQVTECRKTLKINGIPIPIREKMTTIFERGRNWW